MMEAYPDVSKRRKDAQSECTIPEEAGLSDSFIKTVPNANWGAEPNFNLNLNLVSPRSPHLATETLRLHGGSKNGNKGKSKGETGKSANTLAGTVMSPGERDDPLLQKSKIPALSRSPTAEALVSSKDDQRLKCPNPKHTLKTLTRGNVLASPKPHLVEQTAIASSPRTTERLKRQEPKAESASISNMTMKTTTTNKLTVNQKMQTNQKEDGGKEIKLETQSLKTFHPPIRHRGQNQTGDTTVTNSKMANQTLTATQKPDSANTNSKEQTRPDPRTHSSETTLVGPKLQNQKAEMAQLCTKTPQTSSLSPKPSTQRKVPGTRNSNASGSKENLDSKDSSVGSGSKTSSKSTSISRATTVTKESLNTKTGSKTSPKSAATMGSKDSLDSKSGSASKTSWDSKDSLDSKTGSNSKASPNCKSGTGSRDSIDSKAATEVKAIKTSPDLKTCVDVGSKDDLDPSDLKASLNPKTSPSLKPSLELNLSYNSELCSSSKPGSISLVASGSKIDLVGPVSSSSSRNGLSGSKDGNLKTVSAKPSPKAGSDSFKAGPVRSSSKLALADLSSSVTLSPKQSSASRSPGSGPGKSLCSVGPNREVQRSPGSAPGSGLLIPLATSSPKTKTAVALTKKGGSSPGTVAMETTHSTSLTVGLTFDSKTSVKTGAAHEEEHLKPPGAKVTAAGGPVVSQGAVRRVDVTDNAGWSLGKQSQLGDANVITAGSNIPSSRAVGVKSEKEQRRDKQQDDLLSSSSSPFHPLPQPSSVSPKMVRDSSTMTDPSERLHPCGEEQRDVGVQVEVEVVERSASTCSTPLWGAPTSSLIGSPSCQSGSLTSPTVPSQCCVPAGQPPFQHVCKIDIELHSQSLLPSAVSDRASSLPACLRTYSFQQNPTFMSELGPNQDASADSICEEEEEEEGVATKQNKKEEQREEVVKPQEVAWDKQGMTWEVYGAAVDLECLGTAIQSHLESKIQEQEKHITSLRKSICSNNSLRGCRMKKRKEKRGGILGCCRKAPAVAD